LLLGLTNTISTDLSRFTSRLLSRAQLLVLVSSAGPELMFPAGIITYVSSAYFAIKFAGEDGCKSDAVMMSDLRC